MSPLVKSSKVTQSETETIVEFCDSGNIPVLQLKQPRRVQEPLEADRYANLRELLGENFESIITHKLSSAAF